MRPVQGTTYGALLRAAAERLQTAGIDDAQREARMILRVAMAPVTGETVIDASARVDPHVGQEVSHMVGLRAERRPMSHVIGYRAFWQHDFEVTPDVLDPRPETEALVRAALGLPWRSLLDLGTGSGAIAVSLLAARPGARGVAGDIAGPALRVAAANAARIGVADRLELIESNWFDAIEGRFDLIVSNPPYIAADEMGGLAPELAHEPRIALTDDADGLTAYRAIATACRAHLKPAGHLLVEIGARQAKDVSHLFSRAGLVQIEVIPDLDGRDRVVRAQAA